MSYPLIIQNQILGIKESRLKTETAIVQLQKIREELFLKHAEMTFNTINRIFKKRYKNESCKD